MQIVRFENNPIIRPSMLAGDDGANINGPSLIRAPSWLAAPLGKYYLYFAHHAGRYIRLAVADDLAGPWRIHPGGALRLEQTPCALHIASPDVHVDDERREIRMYYHGVRLNPDGRPRDQRTYVAASADGLHFTSGSECLGDFYFRVFRHKDTWYASCFGGRFFRSRDGVSPFEPGPTLLQSGIEGVRVRHTAVQVRDDVLRVFFSRIGDNPERIMLATIRLHDDWTRWSETKPRTVLQPETVWEGADLPAEPSIRGWAPKPARQLRDPAIFEDNGAAYLLYSVAGESGIAIAEIRW